MGLVSFFVLFAVSHCLLRLSAEKITDHRRCPPFECGKLSWIGFPFANSTNPECGLCTVDGCTEDVQKIQLEKDGRWYHVESISQANNKIKICDKSLENFQFQNCSLFYNITPCSSPSISFHFDSKNPLTLFKCKEPVNDTFNNTLNHRKCHDFNIYYNLSENSLSSPSECEVLQLPLEDDNPRRVALTFSLEAVVTDDCKGCHIKRGQCMTNSEGKFHCANAENGIDFRTQTKKKDKLALKLGAGIGGPVLLITIFSLGFYFIRRRYKQKYDSFLSRYTSSDHSKSDLEGGSVYFGVSIFSYSELEKATNNFDHDKELGDGGFGTVYYGKLKDGREVAVKRLYEHNYRRVEQFLNEVEILTRLRHRNLVSLYGCTSRRSRELLLVYEYIPNGTVADHLHGDRAVSGSLTWSARMNIAVETASALVYLHASEIIHRDVKTNNILLDDNFGVKVADFGLSRLFPNDVTHVSTAPQGTPGYVDPEYHQCYQLTVKSDVYSFGVVLVELISSMPAVDISRHRHEINLSNYAINKIQKGAFNELIDPNLGFESDETVRRMTVAVAMLAFKCLQQDKDMRPSMDEVSEALKKIELGNYEEGNVQAAGGDAGVSLSVLPPPSPDCDEVDLLKNMRPPHSPDSVTDKWLSSNSSITWSANH